MSEDDEYSDLTYLPRVTITTIWEPSVVKLLDKFTVKQKMYSKRSVSSVFCSKDILSLEKNVRTYQSLSTLMSQIGRPL